MLALPVKDGKTGWDWPQDVWASGTAMQLAVERPALAAERTSIPFIWGTQQERDLKWHVIRQKYSVLDAAATGAFVLDHAYLLDLLLEAYFPLQALFDEQAQIQVRLKVDPEIPDRRYLSVRVVTRLSAHDALRRMDRFDQDWWLDRIAHTDDDLVFSLGFA